MLLPLLLLPLYCAHRRGVQVLIDGAHALGQVHLDLQAGVCGGSVRGDAQEEQQQQQPHSEAAAAVGAAVSALDINGSAAYAGAAATSKPSSSSQDPGSNLAVPDYFVTNCHKWLAAPRGTAVMWVRRDRQAAVRPLVVSHGSGAGFTSDFIWDGGWNTYTHTRCACIQEGKGT